MSRLKLLFTSSILLLLVYQGSIVYPSADEIFESSWSTQDGVDENDFEKSQPDNEDKPALAARAFLESNKTILFWKDIEPIYFQNAGIISFNLIRAPPANS